MPFPEHLATILDAYGVRSDTKAALYDLYVSLGDEVLEVFSDLAEGRSSPSLVTSEETAAIRAQVVERSLATIRSGARGSRRPASGTRASWKGAPPAWPFPWAPFLPVPTARMRRWPSAWRPPPAPWWARRSRCPPAC